MKSKLCFVSVDVEHDFGKIEKEFSGVKNLDKILDIFSKHGVTATLFITGEAMEKYEELAKKWALKHEIACHSFTHLFWDKISAEEKRGELRSFKVLYQKMFGKDPGGFRAPSHIIDQEGIKILREGGFLYDSSVVPRYPFLKKYRGYRGRAPLAPYYPDDNNCKKEGVPGNFLEIPVSGLAFGIPVAGAWLKKLPFIIYRLLFIIKKPDFLAVSMHSWDSESERFLESLDKVLRLLKNIGYNFQNGEQIFKNNR